MVKDLFKGFLYTLGKILAFIFILLVIGTLLTKIDSDNIKNLPLRSLIMKTLFVESHALEKKARFYYGVGTSNVGTYLDLNEQQLSQGANITHQGGLYPNGLAIFITGSSFTQGKKYVVNVNYNIRTEYQYQLPNNWLSVGTWSNSGDTVGTSNVVINSSTLMPCGTNNGHVYYCYDTNISFTGEWTQPWNTSAIIAFSQFDGPNHVYYIKLNSFTTTLVTSDNSDVINNNNQNTSIIINNNNQNTENIINAQNDTTDAINDLNDTITDTTITGNSIGAKFGDIYLISDTPITDLITMPIHLLQKIYNSLQYECTPYTLPFDFGFSSLQGYTISLPCLNLGHENRFGRIVWGYIDDLFCIFMIYNIFKMVIYYYDSWTSLKDNFEWLIDPSTRGLPY